MCHTDLQRDKGYSLGVPLDRINWGNFDLVVIDESHNFRNNEVYKDRETRYQKLMSRVIKTGVSTKVLMLSATPVNNRFNDLKNQLAMLVVYISLPIRANESLEELVERAQKIRKKERELQILDAKMAKEKQFKKKVDINTQIRNINSELAALTDQSFS